VTKQLRINAFDMNCPGHLSPGLWRHPRDRSASYKDLDYWIDLAKTLERGKVDALFIADVLGLYDVYGGTPDAAIRNCTQVPLNDPGVLVPAMAAVTEHLGFAVTYTLSFEPPYPFARRASTLDHLSKGRFGWNVVTGYLDSAAKGAGLAQQTGHDLRYDIAEEYMSVVYSLWEGSWRRAQSFATAHAVCSRTRKKCTGCVTRANIIGSMRFTSASPRRSVRRSCSRPALRRRGGTSPPAMPRACSLAARRVR
jgi:alkanesulfonate monooxygenase SsuD/methylene tetrahydromethanopterin reductase-like flavin-dependent oxidoreductase (luciferase family)